MMRMIGNHGWLALGKNEWIKSKAFLFLLLYDYHIRKSYEDETEIITVLCNFMLIEVE